MARPTTRRRRSAAGRSLLWFWVLLLLAAAGGAAWLQHLGPPAARVTAPTSGPTPAPDVHGDAATEPDTATAATTGATTGATTVAAPPPVAPTQTAGLAPAEGPDGPGVIAAPDPALLEASTTYPGGYLPRIAADGRVPMRVYAAPAPDAAGRPRIAVLLANVGASESDSMEAIRDLPGAVSLAVTPYAYKPERVLAAARSNGHETLLGLPLEPDRYPIDDAGNQSLLTGNPPAVNQQRLEWALTRFAGYVGATGTLAGMRGERFGAAPDLIGGLTQTLARRGLLYIDPRPQAARLPNAFGRAVDIVVDEPAVRAEIEGKLAKLEAVARDRGTALGLAAMPRPVTVDRLAAWASTLADRGFVLVPVSALALPPPEARTAQGDAATPAN